MCDTNKQENKTASLVLLEVGGVLLLLIVAMKRETFRLQAPWARRLS